MLSTGSLDGQARAEMPDDQLIAAHRRRGRRINSAAPAERPTNRRQNGPELMVNLLAGLALGCIKTGNSKDEPVVCLSCAGGNRLPLHEPPPLPPPWPVGANGGLLEADRCSLMFERVPAF